MTNFVDAQNHIAYEIDLGKLRRVEQTGSRTGKPDTFPMKVRSQVEGSMYTVQVAVAAARITVRVLDGKEWEMIHAWSGRGRNYSLGKFGFDTANEKDKMRVSHLALER